jgi:hypothetical protein
MALTRLGALLVPTEPTRNSKWLLRAPCDPSISYATIFDEPTPEAALQRLRPEMEIPDAGRALFQGSLRERNRLWGAFSNYARQGRAQFNAGNQIPNRLASLLYYYALLNFAKAELVTTQPNLIIGQRLGHGLSYNPETARTIRGDYVTVTADGVFPKLYEKRTGRTLSAGTRIPVRRVLARIPEIVSQLNDVGLGPGTPSGLLQLIATDESRVWIVLALAGDEFMDYASTWSQLRRALVEVDPPRGWHEHFGISRRSRLQFRFLELREKVEIQDDMAEAIRRAQAMAWAAIRDFTELSSMKMFDAWLCPSLYKRRMLPMIPSLARYVTIFYASSIVRYRPSMFDSTSYPDNAYIFDAVARECSETVLFDVLSGIKSIGHEFVGRDSYRV